MASQTTTLCGSPTMVVSSSVPATPIQTATIAITYVDLLPPILAPALVERVVRRAEGDLIVAVAPVWKALVEAFRNDPEMLLKIDPRKFEELIAGAYELAGFDEVILTPRSGDLGRDVIATKRGFLTVRVIEQVKRYSAGHLVTAEEVRALYGTLSRDQGASKGLVTTTSDFAPGCAKEFDPLIPTRLELINRTELQRRLNAIAASV